MSEVKRYGFKLSAVSEIMGVHLEVVEYSGDGQPFVLASDYDALAGQMAQRDAEIEGLNAELGHVRSGRSELQSRVNALESQQAASVRRLREALEEAKTKLAACNLTGHQHEISVNISGIGTVRLTDLNRNTGYASRLIRGREMLMLGTKKILSANVDAMSARVSELESQVNAARVTA